MSGKQIAHGCVRFIRGLPMLTTKPLFSYKENFLLSLDRIKNKPNNHLFLLIVYQFNQYFLQFFAGSYLTPWLKTP